MDWYPLFNSIRIALLSTVLVFFAGIGIAYSVLKLPRTFKGILDVILTLPLVLPPTVVGYALIKILGPSSTVGEFLLNTFSLKLTMQWWSAVFSTFIVSFPLMYRTARGSFEAFDSNLQASAQTLGLSNFFIFWKIRIPCCKQGLIAGLVLAFARSLGEYGATSMIAGYIPGKTATVSTTLYQLWRNGNDELAFRWVMVNLALSFIVLVAVNLVENPRNLRKVKNDETSR